MRNVVRRQVWHEPSRKSLRHEGRSSVDPRGAPWTSYVCVHLGAGGGAACSGCCAFMAAKRPARAHVATVNTVFSRLFMVLKPNVPIDDYPRGVTATHPSHRFAASSMTAILPAFSGRASLAEERYMQLARSPLFRYGKWPLLLDLVSLCLMGRSFSAPRLGAEAAAF